MIDTQAAAKLNSPIRRPAVRRLLIIALLAEIGYAVLNISTMQVYLRDDRHFGESVIGLVLVAFLLSEAILKGPMGHFADRFGPKKLMLVGPSLSVGTSLVSLVVPHLNGSPIEVMAFVLLRALDGIGAAMLWPAAFASMGNAVEDGERQQAMSLLNLCYMLGIAFAFPLGGVANDWSHTKWAGLIMAAVLFAAVSLTVWRLVPEGKPSTGSALQEEHGEFKLGEFLASMRQIPAYLLLAVVTFAGIGFPMAIFKLFPQDVFKMSESAIGLLILPGAIVMGILSVPMSRLGERIGRARAVHLGLALCAIGMSLIGVGAFLPFMRHRWILAIGGVPVGVGFLLAIPAWMASVSDIDAKKRGANLGAIMTAQGLGAIIGAPVGAALYEKLQPVGESLHFGNVTLGKDFGYYSPFLGCAACLIFGWLLSLRILRDPAR